jgi:hypothetical protein
MSGEDIFSVELAASLIIGLGGGIALLSQVGVAERVAIAADFLSVVGPLLGVVFAAFALVIALFSDEYIRVLSENSEGIAAFLRPFLVAIGVQVGTILLAVAYRAAASSVPSKVEVTIWLAVCFLFVFALLDVVALGRNVLLHGVTRAKEVEVRDLEESRGLDAEG